MYIHTTIFSRLCPLGNWKMLEKYEFKNPSKLMKVIR